LLLKRDTKQGDPSHFVTHNAQKIVNIGSLLNVIGQMKMGIVELEFRVILRSQRNGRR
jgi:hypothetical protein